MLNNILRNRDNINPSPLYQNTLPSFVFTIKPLLFPLAGWIPILIIIPIAIIELTIELSPELRNGSGNPVLGKILVATPILKNI